ncbi:methyltransferase domain-containing protein [Nonomuraea sp. NPDC050404]|uniref:methyltransferase domain-containing protein n=1 Tax=Nonomuraea sp. NPDC050404 TaxID=3155783 RepID=UPI0033F2F234
MDVPVGYMERLIAALDPHGSGDLAEWVGDAVRAVPRHQFVPDVGLIAPRDSEPYLIDRVADPAAWWDVVGSTAAIVTQLDDGATPLTALTGHYTSSSSSPATVADLLNVLAPEPGMRVLDIGTGTGWTAGLLSHVAGPDRVVSIDVDRRVSDQAAKNLAAVGLQPHLVVGDGARGCRDFAPYDRIHVTCGIRDIPYAWVKQCRPGAIIVLPWHPGFGTGHCLRLEVRADGTARGRVVGFAGYMMMRAQRLRPDERPERDEERRRYWTALDPRALDALSASADLAVSALTGLCSHTESGVDEDGEWLCMRVSDPADPGSWATVMRRPGRTRHVVQQAGDRPVWDEVLRAYVRWVEQGEPSWSDFGVTVMAEGTRVWLHSPDNVL